MSEHYTPADEVIGYHEATKHRFDGYARGPATIDWEAQPDLFRRFAGCREIKLPLDAETIAVRYGDLDRPQASTVPWRLEMIARLLEMSLGLSAWKQYGSARWSLRCNPSSGNLHPTEAYLVLRGLDGLDDGLYHYRADRHLLEQRCRFPAATPASAPEILLGLSSVHWREAWKYGERAYRYCQLDAGHAVAALSFAAATLGQTVTPLYHVGDSALARLLGIDRTDEFHAGEAEHPDLLLALHGDASVDVDTLLSAAGDGEWSGHANLLDPHHHYEWPIIDVVAHSAVRPATAPMVPASLPALPPLPVVRTQERAAELFRRRRSAQAFDGATAMEREAFFRLLDRLLPRAGIAPWDTLPWAPRVHPLLFVHRVDGIAPGLYLLPRSAIALTELRGGLRGEFVWERVTAAPAHLPLHLLLAAKAERTAARLSCLQEIAGDSAFSVGMLAEFEPHLREAPWRYRELFWEAGVLGQALYLEAEACGMRGTGIGCFFDDGVHELLGLADRRWQSLYHFTVGAPLQDQRIITLPPYGDRD